jgi:hypothetical protein
MCVLNGIDGWLHDDNFIKQVHFYTEQIVYIDLNHGFHL